MGNGRSRTDLVANGNEVYASVQRGFTTVENTITTTPGDSPKWMLKESNLHSRG